MALTIFKISEYVNWSAVGGATYITGGGGPGVNPPTDLSIYYTKSNLQIEGESTVNFNNLVNAFHNNLLGLEGGLVGDNSSEESSAMAGEYYHLDEYFYNRVNFMNFVYSLTEDASHLVSLVNDVATPGNNMYYGTNITGTKGWFPLPEGGLDSSGNPIGGDSLWEEDSIGDLSPITAGAGITVDGLFIKNNTILTSSTLYLDSVSSDHLFISLGHAEHQMIYIVPPQVFPSNKAGINVEIRAGQAYSNAETYTGGNLFITSGLGSDGTPATQGRIYFGDSTYIRPALPPKTTETNVVYFDTTTGALSHGSLPDSPIYVMSIEESVVETEAGITIAENFESYTIGILSGQGSWTGPTDNTGIEVCAGKTIGYTGVSSYAYGVLELPDLVESAGFDFEFEIAVLPLSNLILIYIGNSTAIDIHSSYADIYIYTEDGYGEIESDTPYEAGDVVIFRRRGLNITMYRNGVIDTTWYDYNDGGEDLSGSNGEFVLKSPFNWSALQSIQPTFYETTSRLDNITMHYNIGETALGEGVHLVNDQEDPGPGMYYGTADDSLGEKGWYPVEDIGQTIVLYNNILEWDTVNNYYRPYTDIPVAAGEGMLYNWYAVAVGLGESDDFESYNVADLAGQGPWLGADSYYNSRLVVIAGKYITNDLGANDNDYGFAWVDVTVSTDQFAEIVIGPQNTTSVGYSELGVCVRLTENSDGSVDCFYFVFDNDDYYYVGYLEDGNFTEYYSNNLGLTGYSPAEGDVIRLEIEGNELRTYYNGVLFTGSGNEYTGIIDVSGDLPTAGVPGVRSYTSGTPSSTDMIVADIFRYGALHNIANDGWHLSTRAEWGDLYTYVEESYGLIDPLIWTVYQGTEFCTNEYGLNVGYIHHRAVSGEFFGASNYSIYYWNEGERNTDTVRNYAQSYEFYGCCGDMYDGYLEKHEGHWVRLVKDSTSLGNGESGTYTGNDGKTYSTICINGKEWVAEDLRETKYRDGTDIALVTDGGDWEVDINGARCWYENISPSGAAAGGVFYTGESTPSGTERLNFNGYLYATGFFSGGLEVGESIWQKDSTNLITSIEPGCDLKVDHLETTHEIKTFNIPLSDVLLSGGVQYFNGQDNMIYIDYSNIGKNGAFGFNLPLDYELGTEIWVQIIYTVGEDFAENEASVQWELIWEYADQDRPIGTDLFTEFSGDQGIDETALTINSYWFNLDGSTSEYEISAYGFIGCWLHRVALDSSGTDPSEFVGLLGVRIHYYAHNAIYWD